MVCSLVIMDKSIMTQQVLMFLSCQLIKIILFHQIAMFLRFLRVKLTTKLSDN